MVTSWNIFLYESAQKKPSWQSGFEQTLKTLLPGCPGTDWLKEREKMLEMLDGRAFLLFLQQTPCVPCYRRNVTTVIHFLSCVRPRLELWNTPSDSRETTQRILLCQEAHRGDLALSGDIKRENVIWWNSKFCMQKDKSENKIDCKVNVMTQILSTHLIWYK